MTEEWKFVDNSCPTCGADLTKELPEHVFITTSDSPEPEAQERTVARCPSCGACNVVVPKAAKLPEPVVEPPAPEPEPEPAVEPSEE